MRLAELARRMLLGCGVLSMGTGLLFGGDSEMPAKRPLATLGAPDIAGIDGDAGPIVLVDGTESTYGPRGQVRVLAEGTSSRAALKTAKSRLPLARLSPANRQRAAVVLENLSMFRAMPTIRVPVDHDVYRFFVNHPDVAVSTWRALDVSKCQLWQTGPNSYETEIGDGSFGALDVLLRGSNNLVVIGEGKFKSPLLLNPIEAVGVMHLRTRFVTRPDGETDVICHGNLFVSFPSQTVETAAKVISPLTNMVIDRNFQEVGLYAHVMTRAMRNQPGWVENLAGQLDGILESSRTEFLEVTARAYVAHCKRELARDGYSGSASQFIRRAEQEVVVPAAR